MAGVPSICPTLRYRDAKAAIKLLTAAFGFSQVAVYEGEDGSVMHAELAYGNGLVMLGSKGTGSVFDKAMEGGGPAGSTSWSTMWTPTTGGPRSTAWRS